MWLYILQYSTVENTVESLTVTRSPDNIFLIFTCYVREPSESPQVVQTVGVAI